MKSTTPRFTATLLLGCLIVSTADAQFTGGGGTGGRGGAGGTGGGLGTGGQSFDPLNDFSPFGATSGPTANTNRGGSSAGGLSSANAFAGYYNNPLAGGLPTASNGIINSAAQAGTFSVPFGQALYADAVSQTGTAAGTTGSTSGAGRIGTSGTTGTTRLSSGATGTTGLGTSGTGRTGATVFGQTGFGQMGRTGFGQAGFNPTGFAQTGLGMQENSMVPANISYQVTIGFRAEPRQPATIVARRQTEIQGLIARSPSIRTAANVQVLIDGGEVILRGRVERGDARRIIGMVSLSPGVESIRDEMEYPGKGEPDPE